MEIAQTRRENHFLFYSSLSNGASKLSYQLKLILHCNVKSNYFGPVHNYCAASTAVLNLHLSCNFCSVTPSPRLQLLQCSISISAASFCSVRASHWLHLLYLANPLGCGCLTQQKLQLRWRFDTPE